MHDNQALVSDISELLNSKQVDTNRKTIVVQGMGFVGSVMSLVCANSSKEDYLVIGVDLPNEKNLQILSDFNNGKLHINSEDPKVNEFYQSAIKKNNIVATTDPKAYSLADVIIVDVNLDVDKRSSDIGLSYDVDLTNFKTAINTIGKFCKEDILILVETTVPPGTTAKVVTKVLKQSFDARGLDASSLKIGHSYERVMPGPEYIDSILNFYRVYSGINDKSAITTKNFLESIINTTEYPLTQLNNTTATEMAKVLENSYRAMNISFIVEWSRMAERAGVNLFDVIKAIKLRKTHSNMMFPGIGVGGYCLTKDPLLASWSNKNFFNANEELEASVRAVEINDSMPAQAFNFLRTHLDDLEKKRFVLLGISYRGDVGDTRYSPAIDFFNLLQAANYNVFAIHDPYVDCFDGYTEKIHKDFSFIEDDFDVMVISAGHSAYLSDDFIDKILKKKNIIIFDTLGMLSANLIEELQIANKVLVIGRGDL